MAEMPRGTLQNGKKMAGYISIDGTDAQNPQLGGMSVGYLPNGPDYNVSRRTGQISIPRVPTPDPNKPLTDEMKKAVAADVAQLLENKAFIKQHLELYKGKADNITEADFHAFAKKTSQKR